MADENAAGENELHWAIGAGVATSVPIVRLHRVGSVRVGSGRVGPLQTGQNAWDPEWDRGERLSSWVGLA
jgi:hypothetical protein